MTKSIIIFIYFLGREPKGDFNKFPGTWISFPVICYETWLCFVHCDFSTKKEGPIFPTIHFSCVPTKPSRTWSRSNKRFSWCLVLDQVISLDLRWWGWTIQSPLLQRTTLHCTKNWKVSLSPGRAGGPEAASLRKSWRRQRQSWDALELGTLCSECSQKLKAWSLFTNCKLLQRRRMLHFLDTRLGSIDMYRHLSLPPTLNPWSL